MKKRWDISVDGVNHTIEYKQGFTCKLLVDGHLYKVKSSNIFVNVIDYSINIGSSTCKLVCIGNSVDLAVNGVFLGSGEEYVPTGTIPPYVWVFTGISTIGGMIFSGIFSLLVGLLMSQLYVKFALKKNIGAVIGFFVLCSFIQFLIGVFLVFIQLI